MIFSSFTSIEIIVSTWCPSKHTQFYSEPISIKIKFNDITKGDTVASNLRMWKLRWISVWKSGDEFEFGAVIIKKNKTEE